MVQSRSDRLKSVIGVAAIHAAIGYALIAGLGFQVVRDTGKALKLFDVPPQDPPPPPPIEEAVPAEVRTDAEEGAAAPPGLKAQPSPVVVEPPKVRLPVPPPPVVAAPVAGVGAAPSAGASEIEGLGTGAGGEGTGTGSGGSGDGTGGGGVVSRARLVGGRLVNADYPDAAGDAGAEGTVQVELQVGADGRVDGCRISRSSGNADLDSTTCRLAALRFRYEPARNARGDAVPDVTGWSQDWWIGKRKRR